MFFHVVHQVHSDTRPLGSRHLLAVSLLAASLASPAFGAWIPGLSYGKVPTNRGLDLSISPMATNSSLSILHGASNDSLFWGNNTMWIYWGQIYLDGSVYRFGENIDDQVSLRIDGQVVLNNYSSVQPTFGTIWREPGWYDFDLRMFNAGGGAGAVQNTTFGFTKEKGLCYTKGTEEEVGELKDASSFLVPADPGDGTLFHFDNGTGFDDTLSIVGFPSDVGAVDPPYGYHGELTDGASFVCSAPESVETEDTIYTFDGYRLYDVDPVDEKRTNSVAVGTVPSFDYLHRGHRRLLEWRWKADSFRLSIVPSAHGVVAAEEGFHKAGSRIPVSAMAEEGSDFTFWSGDLLDSQVLEPSIEVDLDRPRSLRPHFGKRYYVAPTGDDTADGLAPDRPLKTIGEAVARAEEGDAVLVAAGTYASSSELSVTKGILLVGLDGREVTRIRGNRKFRLLYVNHPEARVTGFTLENGHATAEKPGGGVMIDTLGGVVDRCRVTGCSTDWRKEYGSAVQLEGGMVSRCLIDRNSFGYEHSGTVGMGGGLLENCVITDNQTHGSGGGIFLTGGVARNCTIVGNLSTRGGAGVYRSEDGRLENCIIWGNRNRNSAFALDRELSGAAFEVVDHCCIQGMAPLGGSYVGGDPLFVDPANGDFRLQASSPCIDAGRDVSTGSGLDFAGGSRRSGASVDIGAYEFDQEGFSCGFRATVARGLAPLETTLAPFVRGAGSEEITPQLRWRIDGGDGTVIERSSLGLGDQPVVLPAGWYAVTLEATDPVSGRTASTTVPRAIAVSPERIHVAGNPPASRPPYDSWENAATNLEEALAFAHDGTTILLSNGIHRIEREIVLDRGITLKGLGGYEKTTIQAPKVNGVRVLLLAHPLARVEGLTLRDGRARQGSKGGGVMIPGNGGTLFRCRVTGSTAHGYDCQGGGLQIEGGLVSSCLIDGNALMLDSTRGGGVYQTGGILENSLIVGNRSSPQFISGGGVFVTEDGIVRNCTIAGNYCYRAAGLCAEWGGVIQNCIIWGNEAFGDGSPGAPNWGRKADDNQKTLFQNTCTPVSIGTDCLTADPVFADPATGDYSLLPGSPCVDAGRPLEGLPAVDFAGKSRVTGKRVDIGAYEYDAGVIRCAIVATPSEAVGSAEVSLRAVVFGFGGAPETLSYAWTFREEEAHGPDRSGIGLSTVRNRYDLPGRYDVRLEVTDPASGESAIARQTVHIAPKTLYLLPANDGAAPPYDSWETAGTNIHEVLAEAAGGSVVVVSNGTYEITRVIELSKAIHLRSVNGYGETILKGNRTRGVQIVSIVHPDAIVEGFTIRGGGGTASGFGGGVGVKGGTLRRCFLTDHFVSNFQMGGAVHIMDGLVDGCIISNQGDIGDGGGVSMVGGVCQNSLIVGCQARRGGGVYMEDGILRNCTITGNRDRGNTLGGGGVYRRWKGDVVNCIIRDNVADKGSGPGSPDWAYEGNITGAFRNNCTPIPIGTDCVVADPLFRAPEKGDYRIRSGSPCRDAGLYEEWMAGATDFWGNPRVDVRRRVDIGAHEETSSLATILFVR